MPIKTVIVPEGSFPESGQTPRRRKMQGNADQDTPLQDAYTDPGIMVNSEQFDGHQPKAKAKLLNMPNNKVMEKQEFNTVCEIG